MVTLADYGITYDEAERLKLISKHGDALAVFFTKFTDDPNNTDPPTREELDQELARLEREIEPDDFYGTSAIKRKRRTKNQMQELRNAIKSILGTMHPMTDRQVFYQMSSRGYVEKLEAQYKGTVCRLLSEMRLDGTIPFEWIVDSTRWMIKPKTYNSMDEALLLTVEMYRRSLWSRSNCYVEIWCEKQALAGIISEITEAWDVPLMVNHGFGSLSYLHNAAKTIERNAKPAYIYYLADYDPSGVEASNNTERRLRQFAPNAEIHFERIAVTPEQIKLFHLPTRPTKKTDSRAKKFGSEVSVELDALPVQVLRDLVEHHILYHVDHTEYARLLQIEKAEKESLCWVQQNMNFDNGKITISQEFIEEMNK